MIRTIILSLVIITPALGYSQAGDYLNNPVSPRSAALGNSETILYEDPFAAEHNPAGLGQFNHTLINASNTTLFGQVKQRHFSIASSIWKNTTIGYSYMDNVVDSIKRTTSDGIDTGETFGYNATSHRVSTGFKLPYLRDSTLGFAARLMKTQLDNANAQALGLDAGLQIAITPFARLGVMGENLNSPKFTWSTDLGTEEAIPYKLSSGLAINLADNLDIYGEVSRRENEDAVHHVGLEWHILNRDSQHLQLRAGLTPQRINAGVGLRIGGLTLDYAYTAFSETYMDASHSISLSVSLKHKERVYTQPQLILHKYTDRNSIGRHRKQLSISGKAYHLKKLKVNNENVTIRPNGTFYHVVLLEDTYTTVTVTGQTQNGNTITKEMEFIKR